MSNGSDWKSGKIVYLDALYDKNRRIYGEKVKQKVNVLLEYRSPFAVV